MAADAAIESGTPLKSVEEMVEEADVADGLDPATAAELAPMAAVPAADALTDDPDAADARRQRPTPSARRSPPPPTPTPSRGDAARLNRPPGHAPRRDARREPVPFGRARPPALARSLLPARARGRDERPHAPGRDEPPDHDRGRAGGSRSCGSPTTTAIVPFVDLAPAAGPRPEPPLALLGPSLAGALSGLILEDAGRLSIRLATVVPADDPTRPWRVPAAVRAGVPLGADASRRDAPERARRDGPRGLPSGRSRALAIRRLDSAREVGDLFDEFMKELRRRQAEASGRSAEGDKPDDAEGDGDPDDDDPDDRPGAHDGAGDDDQDGSAGRPPLRTVPPADDADDADDHDDGSPATPPAGARRRQWRAARRWSTRSPRLRRRPARRSAVAAIPDRRPSS